MGRHVGAHRMSTHNTKLQFRFDSAEKKRLNARCLALGRDVSVKKEIL